jgi:GDPmannose 4,6-dehydratase
MKKALITGVLGQDGKFLSKLLLSKGYTVIGTHSLSSEIDKGKLHGLPVDVQLTAIDNQGTVDLKNLINKEKPDEVYNLSALSSVSASFKNPTLTRRLNHVNPVQILEFLSIEKPEVKFYQAGSSEMFGLPTQSPQNEATVFNPRSPYAEAKLSTFLSVVNHRDDKGIYAVNGIMYNHESEFRDELFVSRKITKNIARILLKKQKNFTLGDLTITRDWGYAEDYVQAMWLMLQQEIADDYVVATGISRSLYDFVETALSVSGLDTEVSRWVVSDNTLFRENEITDLVGDPSKARQQLGWTPQTPFNDWVLRMIENDIALESNSD